MSDGEEKVEESIYKYLNPEYLRRLLRHRREELEPPVVNPEDVMVELPSDDVGVDAIDAALTGVSALTGELASAPVLPKMAIEPSASQSPPSSPTGANSIDAALDGVAQLTNALADIQETEIQPSASNALGTEDPTRDALNNVTTLTTELSRLGQGEPPPPAATEPVTSVPSPIDEAFNNVAKLTSELAILGPSETQPPAATAPPVIVPLPPAVVPSPIDEAFNNVAKLTSELARLGPSKPPPPSATEPVTPSVPSPIDEAFNNVAKLTSELARLGPSKPPPPADVNVPPPPAATTPVSTVPSPIDEAFNNVAKLTSELARLGPRESLSRTRFDIFPTPPPDKMSSLPKFQFNPADKFKKMLDSWWSEEDETKYEVEEYVTALGSDTKQNLRSTIYDENGSVQQPVPNAAPYQHLWKTTPTQAPVVTPT